MEKEIEVRFLEINKNNLVDKLVKLGAEDHKESLLNEIIFYDADLSWPKENRLVKLRTSNGVTKLTYKHRKDQTINGTYEVEFVVPDLKMAAEFLEGVGLVAFRHQEKKRHSFSYNGIAIDIDTWPKIPTYVEFEGPSEQALKDFASLLGFDWSSAVFENPKDVIEKKYNIPMDTLRWFTFSRCE